MHGEAAEAAKVKAPNRWQQRIFPRIPSAQELLERHRRVLDTLEKRAPSPPAAPAVTTSTYAENLTALLADSDEAVGGPKEGASR